MRDNLFEPADDDADHGAHGRFDGLAKGAGATLWAATHQPPVSMAPVVAALGAAAARRAVSSRGR